MSPLRWLAATRVRLLVASLALYGVIFSAAPLLARWIRDESASVTTDMGLITALFFVFVIAGLVLSILVADVALPGRWRERIILGVDTTAELDDDDIANLSHSKTYLLQFSGIAVLIFALAGGGLDLATGGFFGDYQRRGYFRTKMRGPDHARKVELIDELSLRRRERFVRDAIDQLDQVWRDPAQPPAVRAAAIRSLGRLGKSLISSVESWSRSGDTHGHWEFDAVRQLRQEIAPRLRAALPGAAAPVDATIVLALGKLRDLESVATFTASLTRAGVSRERRMATALSLGLIRDLDAMGAMIEAAPGWTDPEEYRALCWGIGEISRNFVPPSDGTAPPVFDALRETFGPAVIGGPPTRRCDAVHVLAKTGDARIATPLIKAYDAPGAEHMCEATYVDIQEPALVPYGADVALRIRILRAFEHIGVGHDELLDWAEERAKREEDEVMRRHLETLARTGRAAAQKSR